MVTIINITEYKNQKWKRAIFNSLPTPQKGLKASKVERKVEYDDSVADILREAEPECKGGHISKEAAIKIFLDYLDGDVHIYSISDVVPYRDRLWNFPDGIDCWCITFTRDIVSFVIRSSQLIAISKDTGDIIFDGSCNDEG